MFEVIGVRLELIAYAAGALGALAAIWRAAKPPFERELFNDIMGVTGGAIFLLSGIFLY